MAVQAVYETSTIPYLPLSTLDEYLHRVRSHHTLLGSLLDFERPGAAEALTELSTVTTEFDSNATGRGDTYRAAQRNASVRWTGMRQLLRMGGRDPRRGRSIVLDVLGGDGTVARAARAFGDRDLRNLAVLTGDVSGWMVEHALGQGLAAVRQAAKFLFLRSEVVDTVLLAYGTHHISVEHRPLAVAEAARVLRPDGRVVLHDFAETGAVARFFSDVVHPFSKAGHDYPHLTRDGLTALFRDAGLEPTVQDMYDPLIVRADRPDDAKRQMREYIADMYGISAWFDGHEDLDDSWRELTRVFDHSRQPVPLLVGTDIPMTPVVYRRGRRFVAVVPRIALVAAGRKVN